MRKLNKILVTMLVAVVMIGFAVTAFADEPYTAYGYDWFADTYPAQNGYVVSKVVNGTELGAGELKAPNDLFIFDKTGDVYIADTSNNRIVIASADFDPQKTRIMDSFYFPENYALHPEKSGQTTSLNQPQGVFVMDDFGTTLIYIADHDNNRVLACYESGEVWMEYERPSSELYDKDVTFYPRKVIVDRAKNVYICIKSITRGAVMFAENGTFSGYYGANRVEKTAAAFLNYVLKYVLTREQMEIRTRPVPVEFSNFDMDSDGFIYTVTEAKSASLDVLKKLDPAGRNVFEQQGYDEMIWGDWLQLYVNGKSYKSQICDVAIDDAGNIFLLEFTQGRVFQYDYEGADMFSFGGKGDQKGLFSSPAAIDVYDGKVYILDAVKNSVTIYRLTEFGNLVNEAMSLLNRGRYEESKTPWEEVLKRDANYYWAYIGLGNTYLSTQEYKEAMDYFYMHSRGGYNRAFKDFRIDYIRQHFNNFLLIALLIVALLIGLNYFLKWRAKAKKNGEE